MTHWRTLLRDASQLRSAGRIPEAIAVYREALAANPDLPDSWFNLGWLQRQSRAFEDALASYQRALDLGIARPEEVYVNRAAILSEYLHRPRDAERELNAALEKNPRYVQALVNLGNIHEDFGERDLARATYAKVLEIEPDNTLALVRLATCSLSTQQDREIETRLRIAIERPDFTATQRAGLGFALAALLDAAGEHDQAFEAAAAANAACRAAGGSRAVYDRSAQERLVDQLIESFHRPTDNNDDASPAFICGMYRSGSTLIEQILAGHEKVAPAGELDLIPAIVASLPDYPRAAAKADAATVDRWRQFYLAGLPGALELGRIVTDKRPDNFLHIGLIKTIFPGAKIVHTRRNPLDNLVSLHFLHLDASMAYALDLEDAAHWYRLYELLMTHWQSLYGDDILTVDYDALVANPEPVIRELLEFLGLDWDEDCLDFSRGERAVRTASVWQVREPLYQRASGRWRNYARQLERVQALLDGPA